MNKIVRVVPRLDIKGGSLIKGVHLEGLRVLGKPEYFARHYYEQGADELIYMDAVASLYNRNSLHDIISKTAREIFIPLTVGGGLRTIEDITAVLKAGADKVAINTAALSNPEFIKKAAKTFGSSTIVLSIDAIKQPDGKYFVVTNNGREYTGVEAVLWAKQAADFGAGEILITSVDNEGTGKGFDVDLIKEIANAVSIPVIASGGAGKLQHVVDVIKNADVQAVAIASMLHYKYIKSKKPILDSGIEGNTDFISKGGVFSKIQTMNIRQIKRFLLQSEIECRM